MTQALAIVILAVVVIPALAILAAATLAMAMVSSLALVILSGVNDLLPLVEVLALLGAPPYSS